MKRLVFVLAIALCGLLARDAHAGVCRDVQRWLGISYGPGIHAYNGCHGNPYSYAEEVPAGEPETVPAPPAPPQTYRQPSQRPDQPSQGMVPQRSSRR